MPGAGHIQQLQRPGSVERRQTGQQASTGQELDQLADVGGWVLVVAGMHEVALVAGLGVGAVAGSRAEGHGISRASRSTVLQRADAGQELDGQGRGVARCRAHPAVAAAGQRGA
ncbi:hypothetical protein [Sphaerotilus sp.]|uniref:hypothetical protein n=1 Tax=Sphaerotilus sp. TaxID=2093942 RepID=UPI0025ECAFA9|nr:hypothetical protein [Sphaerotilus sp.]